MFTITNNTHCLTYLGLTYMVLAYLLLGVFFMFSKIQTASAEHIMSAQVKEQSVDSKLDILPTLKGHMARLGTLMNILFRDIDDANRKDLVLSTLGEMRLLLTKVGKEFTPTKVIALAEGDTKSKAVAGFKNCTSRAVGFLDEMTTQVKREKLSLAKNSLYALDGWRRDCHSKFAGE
jgi:soluble cytochrome b562